MLFICQLLHSGCGGAPLQLGLWQQHPDGAEPLSVFIIRLSIPERRTAVIRLAIPQVSVHLFGNESVHILILRKHNVLYPHSGF